MNKKIITGFLMFALAVFSMSSFVACKDIDEDSYDDLKARINAQRGDLDKEISLREALDAQVQALKEALSKIKSCTCDPSKYASADDMLDAQRKIAALEEALDKINKYIHDSIGGKGDTTIYVENPYKDDWIKLRLGGMSDSISNNLKLINFLNGWIVYVQQLAKSDSIRIDELEGKIVGWDSVLTNLNKNIVYIIDSLINEKIKHDTIVVELDSSYIIKIDSARLIADSALNLSERALMLAQIAIIRITNLENELSNLGYNIGNLENVIDYLEGRVDDLEDEVDGLKDALDDLKDRADNMEIRIGDLEDRADNMEIRIGDLEDAVSDLIDKDQELQDEIDALKERVDNLLDHMVTGIIIQGTETPVIGYFNTPLDARSQILAAYYGKVEHEVSFPNYYSSADYVDASEFWTERNIAVIGGPDLAPDKINGEFVTKKNGKTTGNAGTLYVTVNPTNVDFTGKKLSLETSQGKLAGITLEKLKASDRELTFGYTRAAAPNGFYEAAATLTEDGLNTAKVRVNFNNLKSAAKEMLKSKTKSSVLNFGFTLLENVKDVMPAYAVKASWSEKNKTQQYDVLSQYGIAATAVEPFSFAFLKDLNVNLPGEQKIINMLDELIDKINIEIDLNLPDFSKYQGSITFKDITLPTIDDDLFRITYTKTYTAEELAGEGELFGDDDPTNLYFLVTNKKGSKYALVSYDDYGNIQLYIYDGGWRLATDDEFASFGAIEFGLTVDVDINKTPELKSLLQDIIDELNANYGADSDLAKTITDLMNDIAALGDIDDKINDAIDDAKEDIKANIADYITKIYNKLNNIFSKAPNKALQPIMIAKDGKKIKALGRSRKLATKVKSSPLTLVPTSYTLELFAPAYKKYIVVSNVWDKNGHWADAKIGRNANGDGMGVIIDNGTQTVTLNGQKGYTYEISYNAVDYQGKIVNKKFYVRF